MAGVAWVFHNVAEMAGNADRIFVGGHSAGGHYASLMAVRRDWQENYALPSDVIRGCVPVSGVYRFGAGSGLSMRPRFLGAEENEIPASSLHNIHGVPPPFLISFGSRDFPHLKIQAQEMADTLVRAGGEVRLLELADCDHLGASLACGNADGQWASTVVEWMRGH
jgi:acetyl esterase/lipase